MGEDVLRYYEREDVSEAISEHAQDREIGIKFDYGYGKRPDVIMSGGDVVELAKRGATSFHFSEEVWHDPLAINAEMNRKQLDSLRKGWDLIIDLDAPDFSYSKVAALLLIKVLQHHGITCVTIKFSGNKGFHLGIPFEAFPKAFHGTLTAHLFPEAPRRIAAYLTHLIGKDLTEQLLQQASVQELAAVTGKTVEDLKKEEHLGNAVVEIDTVLIASRHLCRMPYSLHEKSGLVSLPLALEEVEGFQREDAHPDKIEVGRTFLYRDVQEGEAKGLLVEAYDYQPQIEQEEVKQERTYEVLEDAIPKECFPDCIKRLLEGLDDGRKRALFVLIGFLRSVGWSKDMIEAEIQEWNTRNKEPLREVYIKGQLRYAMQGPVRLPPNCENEVYHLGQGMCNNLCPKIKNPVTYAKRRYFAGKKEKKKPTKKT